MQAALRFIGTNLWGFSQSRTVSLILTHQRRPVRFGDTRKCSNTFSVAFCPCYSKEAANIFACIPIAKTTTANLPLWAGFSPCTLNRKGVTPCGVGSAGAGVLSKKKRAGALSAPALRAVCLICLCTCRSCNRV